MQLFTEPFTVTSILWINISKQGSIMTFQTGSQVTATSYNSILTTVTSVLTNFYGVTTYASPVSRPAVIKTTDWQNLYNDIDRVLVHQTSNHLPFSSIQKGDKIRTAFANSLTTYAATILTNENDVHSSQLVLDPIVSTSARTAVWNSEIIHKIQYSWTTDADAQHFFNQGGYIQPIIDIALLDNSTTTNTNWVNLINHVKSDTAFQNYRYNRTSYNGSLANYSKTETAGSISAIFNKVNGHTIQAQVNFSPTQLTDYMTVFPTASLNEYYSTNASGGILAPRPSAQLIETLNVGGQVTYSILGFTPVSTVTINKYATKTFTITINNSGTGDLTLNSFSFTSDTGTTLTTNSITANTMVVNPSNIATITVTLNASAASAEGSFNGGYITVYSDSITGPVNIAVPVSIIQPIFAVTSNPTAITATVTKLLPQQTNFIFDAGQYGTIKSISANISNTTYFSITNNQSYGFYVTFNPPESASTTVTATLSVTFTPEDARQSSVTLTIPFNYTVQIINSHLGEWVGPFDNTNNVLGMSYDIIDGIRTLTVGFGMGNDGGEAISATNGSTYVSTYVLGKNGDAHPDRGIPLYASSSPSFGTFLQAYGAWITPFGGHAYSSTIDISYTITFPATGYYIFRFSSYGSGEVFFNGNLLSSYNDPSSNAKGNLYVSHTFLNTIRFVINTNSTGGSAFAFVISDASDNNIIWSTDIPKRTAYQYWQEVYRIPLTLGNHTYQSANYLVKATDEAAGYTYGHWCGGGATAGSLFSVSDDGNGNLSFNMNPSNGTSSSIQSVDITVFFSQFMQYYYSEADLRIKNLELPIDGGNTTHYFLGFNPNGGVQTSVVPWVPRPAQSSGGGGITFTDINNIATLISLPGLIADATIFIPAAIEGGVALGAFALGTAGAESFLGSLIVAAGGCFTPETRVKMANGSYLPISKVQIGDYVQGRTGDINQVKFIEIAKEEDFNFLYSPDNLTEPFATDNHPLFIDGNMSCPNPISNLNSYPWLGLNKELIPAQQKDVKIGYVYNLWVTGDHTYTVNDYGTHSIIDDGGGLRIAVEKGYLGIEQVKSILDEFTTNGKSFAFGGYLVTKILDMPIIRLFVRPAAYLVNKDKSSIPRKALMSSIKLLGWVTCKIKGI